MGASRPGRASWAVGRLVLWRERKSMMGSPVSAGAVSPGYSAVTARTRRGRKPMIAVAAHTEPTTRTLVAEVLEHAGWDVHQTDSTEDALEACRANEADVLLIGDELSGGTIDLLE